MGMLEKTGISRRICPVIFMLDTSGSMDGDPIGAVDEAMLLVLNELQSMNDKNPDVEIQVAVMTFDNGTTWITGNSGLISPENVTWNPLDANGMTSMGAAFRELNKVLTAKDNGFMKRASGSVAPVLFLLSDGYPTDDYQDGLQKLKGNNWYKFAARVAVGYGNDVDYDALEEFTGTKESVLQADNPKMLTRMIRFTTITSSMVASTGVASQNNVTPNQAVAEAITEAKENGQLGDVDDFDF